MDLLIPVVLIVCAAGVLGACVGALVKGRRVPPVDTQRPQNHWIDPSWVRRADYDADLAAVRRQLSGLEQTVELRFKSLTGQIAVQRRGKREPEEEQIELPPGPERDAIIDRVLGSQGPTGRSAEGGGNSQPADPDSPSSWPLELVTQPRERRGRR